MSFRYKRNNKWLNIDEIRISKDRLFLVLMHGGFLLEKIPIKSIKSFEHHYHVQYNFIKRDGYGGKHVGYLPVNYDLRANYDAYILITTNYREFLLVWNGNNGFYKHANKIIYYLKDTLVIKKNPELRFMVDENYKVSDKDIYIDNREGWNYLIGILFLFGLPALLYGCNVIF